MAFPANTATNETRNDDNQYDTACPSEELATKSAPAC